MLVASEEATAGSVIEKHDRISPSSSGSQPLLVLLVGARTSRAVPCCRCRAPRSSSPRARSRPSVRTARRSARSRAPTARRRSASSGRNRFHSPCSRALVLQPGERPRACGTASPAARLAAPAASKVVLGRVDVLVEEAAAPGPAGRCDRSLCWKSMRASPDRARARLTVRAASSSSAARPARSGRSRRRRSCPAGSGCGCPRR